MKLDELQKMSETEARRALADRDISYFEYGFRDFLLGDCAWKAFSRRDLIGLRERLSLSQEAFGKLLNVSKQTVLRWEKEGEKVPQWAYPVLTVIDRIEGGVFDVMRGPCNRPGTMADMMGTALSRRDYRGDDRPLPDAFGAEEVKTLRSRLGLTRKAFADLLDVSLSTVDKWESGAVIPKGPALTVLKIVWREGPSGLSDD